MRVSDYIVQRLVSEGIKNVFMVTGGGAMHLNDAFARNKEMKVTCFHHEQASSIAAEGYARISREPCAVNVTTGPGGINALVGVFGAYVDSIPMIIISGQVKLETLGSTYPDLGIRQLGDQEVDIVSMVRPIIKYVKTIRSIDEIENILERALFVMKHGRAGPVWIDIPIDIQGAQYVANEKVKTKVQIIDLISDVGCTKNTLIELNELQNINCKEKQEKYKRSIKKLIESERPVIMIGTGIKSKKEKLLLNKIIELLNIPVVTGWNAMDLLTSDHKNNAGRPGTVGDRAGNFAVQNADFLLIIGCRLNIRQISYNWQSFGKKAYKVMVDIDSTELNKPTLNIDLKIQAKAEEYLEYLSNIDINYINNEKHKIYRDWCVDRVIKYPVVRKEFKEEEKLNPYYFLSEISKLFSEGDIVILGNGSACVMGFQAIKVKKDQRIFTNSGCASMGYDLPAAIGASIASPDKIIYCITGDGSIMMNLQELQTIISLKLPIKIIILNNGGYSSIRQTQKAYFNDNIFGTGPDNGLVFPDFMRLANGFNFEYECIKNIKDLYSVHSKQFDNKKPIIIEVLINEEQGFAPKLASRKNEDGSMTSPELEDMAPFLERKELNKNIF